MVSSKSDKLSRFSQSLSSQNISVGVDVHKRTYSVCLLRDDGVQVTFSMDADIQQFLRVVEPFRFAISQITYEAGPTGYCLARSLLAAGFPVIVIAPSRVPRPIAATNKTDSIDARKLAEYTAKGLLTSIAIPTEEEDAFRRLTRRRNQITDAIRKGKQRIRAVLLSFGIPEPDGLDNWSASAMQELEEIQAVCQDTITSLLRELKFLKGEQKQLDVIINARVEQKLLCRVKSLSGVGQIVATNFLAEVFRPGRFNRPEEVTAYLGLAPIISHSGGGRAQTRLRPVGQQRLRSLIIEAAWIWKGKDERANDFYHRLLSKHGLPQKAIVAVARKLAVRIWKQATMTA